MRAVLSRNGARRQQPLPGRLRDAWYYAGPLADRWYLHPDNETPRWQIVMIAALRPVHEVAFRARLAWLLLTTPRNDANNAPWERRDLRFKTLALLALPWSFGGYEQHRHYDNVLCFDHHGNGYGWSATFIDAPVGWKVRGLHLYTDGDTTW